ncbi:MAG: RnfABCDGE type electron transport complex subunit G [bacterium]
MRDILELVVVLSIICVVAAISLAKVYDITKDPIALQKRLARLQTVNAVLPPHDNEPDQNTVQIPPEPVKGKKNKPILIYKGLQNGRLTGVALEMTAMGYGGEIGVMVGLAPDGTIRGVEITSMSETPGLGAKITTPQFKQQFQGKSLESARFNVKKDGGDFDQIAGATISPRAVVQAVRDGLELYRKHKDTITR